MTVKGKREEVEMVDGRVYVTFDNWQTVYKEQHGRRRLVTGQEADLARYLAVAASSAG